MKRRLIATVALATIALINPQNTAADAGPQLPVGVANKVASTKYSTYIVFMAKDPTIAYEGGILGLAPTAPTDGRKVNRTNRAVARYVSHLETDQNRALRTAGVPLTNKLVTYTYAANGFAASLSAQQAANLRRQPGVLFVVRDQIRTIQSATITDFLGLTAPAGAWASGYTGENVVVGVIDTGIWPEHPSFADDGTYTTLATSEFSGAGCEFGNTIFNPADASFTCNNKILAAKSFGEVFHFGTGEGLSPGSYLSARDEDGHGSHTTSTAAGDANVPAGVFGVNQGLVSGIAPRARISVYKACWSGVEGDGCSNGDLVAAIDTAVADGVDVINYSIGSDEAVIGPDAISFLLANEAGVFVAASAGNAGPGAGTVGSPAVSPWVTAVAASSHDRDFRATLTMRSGDVFDGASITQGTAELPMVDARTLGNVTCLADPGFSPAAVQGRMVLCERGDNGRLEKSEVVQAAGGAAMVLYNADPDETINTDNYPIPTLHVDRATGDEIRSIIARSPESSSGALTAGASVGGIQPNIVASFSSRGPNGVSPDIISPDIAAPGVDVLAANTPTALHGAPGQLFQAISGTSMSSPHVAGVFALLKQAHPDWTPAQAKSALMTSAHQDGTKQDGVTPADPFDVGAGFLNPGNDATAPGSIFNPGLVYDVNRDQFLGYMCEAAADSILHETCAALARDGIATTAENLNLASIGISDITGIATVSRTITNVATTPLIWQTNVEEPEGFSVSVEPSQIRLEPGQSGTYEVTVRRTTAEFGVWSFGSLTWSSDGYRVRSPLAFKAQEIAFTTTLTSDQPSGSTDVAVAFGYSGSYQAQSLGFAEAIQTPGTVIDDPENDAAIALESGVGATRHELEIAPGTAVVRVALFDSDVDGAHDLDLYIFDANDALVDFSGSGTSEEEINLIDPAPGTYTVVVHGYNVENDLANYTLSTWLLGEDDAEGSLVLNQAPDAAVIGTVANITAEWLDLAVDTRYLGAIIHRRDERFLGATVIAVQP